MSAKTPSLVSGSEESEQIFAVNCELAYTTSSPYRQIQSCRNFLAATAVVDVAAAETIESSSHLS